jgi:DegV family protein with EDD domain
MEEKNCIKIAADNTCDLPDNIIKQYDIKIIHHYVNTVHGKFIDGDEITSDNVIEYLDRSEKRLDTEPPSVKDYEEFYKKCLTGCNELIHIVMSKGTSKSYTYALEAAKNFNNVYVVNSKNLSAGYGMIVMKAAELCREGMSTETLINEINEYKELVNFKFIMQSLEMLHKGGRCSSTLLDLTNFFKLHIDMRMRNDKMHPDKVYVGKMPWIYNQFVKNLLSSKNIDPRTAFIVTAGCTNTFTDEIKNQVEKYHKFDNVFVIKASSSISCNCGPGSVGIAYASFSIK